MRNNGTISNVVWDSPAFNAGLTVGAEIVAINSSAYSSSLLANTTATDADGQNSIVLLVKNGDRYRRIEIDWRGGLRYPHLERTGSGTAGIDGLLEPLG